MLWRSDNCHKGAWEGPHKALILFLFITSTIIMTIDRESLIEDYAQQILDSMDIKTMECFVYDTLKDNLSSYSDEELIEEVKQYNPELLEDW